jgi:hypothetical protein
MTTALASAPARHALTVVSRPEPRAPRPGGPRGPPGPLGFSPAQAEGILGHPQ